MKASINELSKVMDSDEFVIYETVWGEMHVEYDIFKKRFDVTPFLKGLPNDRDQCPHWGIVLKGQATIMYNGKEEIVKAGDAYYAPPGHTGFFEAGTELWARARALIVESSARLCMRALRKLEALTVLQ